MYLGGRMTVWGTLLVSLGLVQAAVAETPLVRYQQSQIHMGMSFGVVLYAPDEEVANRAFRAAFARIAALNSIFSDYDTDSEVSRLCDQAPTKSPVAASRELTQVLACAQRFSEQTDGAFDVSVGPLTKLWRRARRNYQLPDPQRLRAAQQAVGYRNVVVHESDRTVELKRPQMRLDFGAIVPGYAADEALREIAPLGITRALVNASGDITVGDPPPGESAWKVDLASLQPGGKPSRSVWVANASVSTSGDAFQFIEINGQRYSHIVDPRTGYGLTRRCSVTVVAKTGIEADALATAVSVLGMEKGLTLIDSIPGTAAFIVVTDGEAIAAHESHRFAEFIR